MKVNYHFKSDIGLYRSNNQDAVKFVKNKYGQSFGVVCDGLGGHNGGETASWMAADLYSEMFLKTDFTNYSVDQIRVWLKKTTLYVQKIMMRYVEKYEQLSDMGTTVSLILIVRNQAFLLNIGDSRIYEYHQKKLLQLTTDHNVLNMLHPSKAASVEKTLWKALTSALGPNKKLLIDTFVINDIEGMTFMLTTDGLHEYLEDYEMIEILENNKKLSKKTKKLITSALDNVSTDNLTILLVQIK